MLKCFIVLLESIIIVTVDSDEQFVILISYDKSIQVTYHTFMV